MKVVLGQFNCTFYRNGCVTMFFERIICMVKSIFDRQPENLFLTTGIEYYIIS